MIGLRRFDSIDDEALFEYYATSQLAIFDLERGEFSRFGEPDIFQSVSPSPDGNYFHVVRTSSPYPAGLRYSIFPTNAEVWNSKGEVVFTLISRQLTVSHPLDGVQTGPRDCSWHPLEPSTLIWVEALDGGDPKAQVPHRDAVLTLRIPFNGKPAELIRTRHRFSSLRWTENGTHALVSDYDHKRRWRRTLLLQTRNGRLVKPRRLWSYCSQDRRHRPGMPILRAQTNGHHAVHQHGEFIFLVGEGATYGGDRPFLDRLNLRTLRVERLFQSEADCYEEVVALARRDGKRFITRHQSPLSPANYFFRQLKTQSGPRKTTRQSEHQTVSPIARSLTHFFDFAPQLRMITKRLLTYQRADGVQLSCTVYLPPDHDESMRLPAVFWSYPFEFSDPTIASQITSSERFLSIQGASHLFLLLEGYAVIQPSMPVIGIPESVNDTYIEQIVMNAQASIDHVVVEGLVDRERITVGGHSYGAAMAVNLLAHTDLFRAGVGMSGAYNRTLTPFGFQNERRTLWEANELYSRVSPLMHADRIKSPLLLIHGEADDNPGTHPIQSELMYQAVCANRGEARLVLLPHESHTYVARESIEHVLYEMISWFERYVKT